MCTSCPLGLPDGASANVYQRAEVVSGVGARRRAIGWSVRYRSEGEAGAEHSSRCVGRTSRWVGVGLPRENIRAHVV